MRQGLCLGGLVKPTRVTWRHVSFCRRLRWLPVFDTAGDLGDAKTECGFGLEDQSGGGNKGGRGGGEAEREEDRNAGTWPLRQAGVSARSDSLRLISPDPWPGLSRCAS